MSRRLKELRGVYGRRAEEKKKYVQEGTLFLAHVPDACVTQYFALQWCICSGKFLSRYGALHDLAKKLYSAPGHLVTVIHQPTVRLK